MDIEHEEADPKTPRKRRFSLFDDSTLIALGFGGLFTILILMVMVVNPMMDRWQREGAETKVYVRYADEAARDCPAIAPRIREIREDGRVTREEASVIGTLLDQAKAAPGGLRTCRYERWRNMFGGV